MNSTLKLRRVRLVSVDASPVNTNAPIVKGPEDVAAIARAILPTDREGFIGLHLDSRNRVISVELISIGSLNASIVHPREVFKAAILANAASIILAHNHPSGDPTPSEEDLAITRRLQDAARIIGIDLLDHVVVASEAFASFKERKLLGK